MRWISRLVLVGAFACSGGQGGGGEPKRPHGSATPDAAVAPALGGPTDQECEALIAHVAALGAAETKSDPPPTTDDRTTVGNELAAQFMPGCRASSRAGYRCAMDAKSLAQLAACKTQ